MAPKGIQMSLVLVVVCLCSLVNGGAANLGILINQTLALTLPGACNVQTPPLSQCNVSPPTSCPTDNSEGAPPTPTTPSVPSIPSGHPRIIHRDIKSSNILLDNNFDSQVLLGSELIKSSSEERSLLKNLGSWLGKIMIGRNQVLWAREIDPKTLIIEVFFCSRASFEAVISLYK
ncbi:hypothetical protein POM88_019706 [Heracleum sosnowskyi]|uniref:Protein kinase domain-containing protein n=1 Tax=Heracleum sosnowskyi TaxID=360622 RepID=A0AAD8IBF4_9APIA|nr:hypothetical protein POM88_019706 [Heracleum sosnowskyi]